jgi:sec-independent protein translocase protein TatC
VRFLRKHRRVAIVINAVIAALATPPDAFSMIALFVPLLVLYELTIVVAALMMRRRRRLEAREMAQASGGPPEPPGTGGVTPTPA